MEEKNMHDGHRKRLTELVLKVGIENVSPVQAIEFILTYIIPRGDVNPLAHRLLDRYGNFSNMLEASLSDLCNVEGLNTRSAQKILGLSQINFYFSACKMKTKLSLRENKDFLDLIEQLMRFKNTENLYLFAINNAYELVQTRRFDLKKVRQVGISPYELYDFMSSARPSYLAVAHNHPNGSALASDDDHNAVDYIKQLIKNFDCVFLDSLVIGKDGIYSEEQKGFLRDFYSMDTLLDVFAPVTQNDDKKQQN